MDQEMQGGGTDMMMNNAVRELCAYHRQRMGRAGNAVVGGDEDLAALLVPLLASCSECLRPVLDDPWATIATCQSRVEFLTHVGEGLGRHALLHPECAATVL
jgi:hypothetical protein